jgi:hypothetical protein
MDAIPHVDLRVGLMMSVQNYAVFLSNQYDIASVDDTILQTTQHWIFSMESFEICDE